MKLTRTIVITLLALGSLTACKSSKNARAKEAERIRQEQEASLRKEQEDRRMKEAEEAARRDEEARRAEEERTKAAAAAAAKSSGPYARLGEYFTSIASSSNVASANSSINEALALFASPEVPVLIVISTEGETKDYDRPTTIRSYLNYLKDQKKNINRIEHLEFNAEGKITEVELKK